jgi:PAS fold
LFPPELAERFRADDRRAMAGQEVQEFEQVVLIGGDPCIFMTKKSAWIDAQGKVIGVIGIARDVTEREWAEKELGRLRAENVYRREETEIGRELGDIVGGSEPLSGMGTGRRVLAVLESRSARV